MGLSEHSQKPRHALLLRLTPIKSMAALPTLTDNGTLWLQTPKLP